MEFSRWAGKIPPEELRNHVFGGLRETQSLLAYFQLTDEMVLPHVGIVEGYSFEKAISLVREKSLCRIMDPAEREKQERAIALDFITSPCYFPRLFPGTQKCVLLRTYQQARRDRENWPFIHEGIGQCFLRFIDRYNQILRNLLELTHPQLLGLMERVELNHVFIDHFLGYSVFVAFEGWVQKR